MGSHQCTHGTRAEPLPGDDSPSGTVQSSSPTLGQSFARLLQQSSPGSDHAALLPKF